MDYKHLFFPNNNETSHRPHYRIGELPKGCECGDGWWKLLGGSSWLSLSGFARMSVDIGV